uniref:acid phosphatase n=1 Tax=Pristionchus pacificus TaxID=54126 RepID=A0A2A6CXX4_PRIPA|eukprot:PDM83074.1 Phosphatase [Pristionchus pacificus]
MFRLLAVCLLAGCALAIRFPSDREKREAWAERTMVKNLEDATPAGLDLAYVNVIWRHGDRSPTSAMVGEKATEEFWTFGGGGYGELSPVGMKQHYKLGKKFYDRCGRMAGVLHSDSDPHGVWSDRSCKWFRVQSKIKYKRPLIKDQRSFFQLGDPASKCPRQDDLWKLVQKTDDYKKANGEYTQQTLQYLRDAIGVDDKAITFENVYKIWDNMLIENIWYPDNVSEWYPYYTKEINEKVTTINDWGIDLVNGIMGEFDLHFLLDCELEYS